MKPRLNMKVTKGPCRKNQGSVMLRPTGSRPRSNMTLPSGVRHGVQVCGKHPRVPTQLLKLLGTPRIMVLLFPGVAYTRPKAKLGLTTLRCPAAYGAETALPSRHMG